MGTAFSDGGVKAITLLMLILIAGVLCGAVTSLRYGPRSGLVIGLRVVAVGGCVLVVGVTLAFPWAIFRRGIVELLAWAGVGGILAVSGLALGARLPLWLGIRRPRDAARRNWASDERARRTRIRDVDQQGRRDKPLSDRRARRHAWRG
jgi:hypothetical protein